MKAAIFEGEGKLCLKEVPVPEIKKDDEVLLKVLAASICGTDIHILSIPPGHPATAYTILGHEYVGEVVDTGRGVDSFKKGDRVVIDPNLTCGLCFACRRGMFNMCQNMTTLGIFIHGGFAEYNVAPQKALHRIPESLTLEKALLAEPLSCVVNGCSKLNLQAGDNVLIFGAGPIGLCFILTLKNQGASKIIVSEPSAFRANYALKLGADLVINPEKENLEESIKKYLGEYVDISIDAVGCLLGEAIKVTRKGGKILLFGMNEKANPTIHQYSITRKELSIFGTFISNFSFPSTIRILENIEVEKLITHRLPLEEIHHGIELMKKGEAIKVMLKP